MLRNIDRHSRCSLWSQHCGCDVSSGSVFEGFFRCLRKSMQLWSALGPCPDGRWLRKSGQKIERLERVNRLNEFVKIDSILHLVHHERVAEEPWLDPFELVPAVLILFSRCKVAPSIVASVSHGFIAPLRRLGPSLPSHSLSLWLAVASTVPTWWRWLRLRLLMFQMVEQVAVHPTLLVQYPILGHALALRFELAPILPKGR